MIILKEKKHQTSKPTEANNLVSDSVLEVTERRKHILFGIIESVAYSNPSVSETDILTATDNT